MTYATTDDFIRIVGTDPPENLEQRLEEATDVVDLLTFNRVRPGLDRLSLWQQEQVKRATCYQASFIAANGLYLSLPMTGFSAGSVSVQLSRETEFRGEQVDPRALRCLRTTGLMSRRIR